MFGLSGHARGDSMLRKSITRNIGLIVLGMCAAGAVVAALEHGVTPPPTSTHVAAFPPLPVYHAPRPIRLAVPPAGSQVVAVGDSWLDGIGADKPAHGF